MITRQRFLVGTGLAATGLAGAATLSFARAMGIARARLSAYQPLTTRTRHGAMAYAVSGDGPPVLMIHGSGGGYDQGQMFAAPLLQAGHRIIAPSRFGYPGSAFPPDPSSENQADAFVDLLDTLKIERCAVAGGSAGALSALSLAIRHPDRCSALVAIVPAAYAPDRPPARPWSPMQTMLASAILRSDVLFWSALSLMPRRLTETVLATNPALLDAASPEERARVDDILRSILPVSERAQGLINDMRLAGNPAPMALDRITAPTLAISLEDDLYLTADAARHIVAKVPGARLVIYPTGGHVFVGRQQALFAEIDKFLKETRPGKRPGKNGDRIQSRATK